jgi:hypothetical protein
MTPGGVGGIATSAESEGGVGAPGKLSSSIVCCSLGVLLSGKPYFLTKDKSEPTPNKNFFESYRIT